MYVVCTAITCVWVQAPDALDAFGMLQTSVVQRLDELFTSINVISQCKDELETNIQSYVLERSLCNKDMDLLKAQVSGCCAEYCVLSVVYCVYGAGGGAEVSEGATGE